MWCRGKLKSDHKKETSAQAAHRFFAEFCAYSSVPGVRYFAEQRRHWSERAFWLIAIVLSLYLCGISVQNTYLKWQRNPVQISFTEKDIFVSDIPFPKITICPEVKADKSKIQLGSTLAEKRNNTSANKSKMERERLQALGLVCPMFQFYGAGSDKYLNDSIYDVILDIAPTHFNTFRTCSWNSYVLSCSGSFYPILTDEGLCFALNALNAYELYTKEIAPKLVTMMKPHQNVTNWSLEKGYTNNYNEHEYPIRIFRTGKYSGIHLWLTSRNSDYQGDCQGSDEGFKITLSTPGDAGGMSKHVYHLPLLEGAEIAIKSKFTTTSEGLRNYEPNQRQCFYSSERQLRFFRTYTQNNCEIECLSNFTKLECGCVKFSMPRDANTSICGSFKVICTIMAEQTFSQINDSAMSFRTKCNCLPACASIEYNAVIDRIKLKPSYFDDDGYTSFSKLTVVFQDHQVETLKRVESATFTDFLGVCGGLLGLFLGVSVLSAIEFIYYFTLRLYCNHRSKSQNIVTPMPRRDNNSIFINVSDG